MMLDVTDEVAEFPGRDVTSLSSLEGRENLKERSSK